MCSYIIIRSLNFVIMKFDLTYRGTTNYNGQKFSVNKGVNEKVFNKLLKIRKKIESKEYGTFNPVYRKDMTSKSVSLTCKTSLVRFKPTDIGNTYNVDIAIYDKHYDDKHYVNVELRSSTLVSKPDKGKETSEYDSE